MSYYDGFSNTYFSPAQIRDTILGFNDVEEDGYPELKTLKGKIKTEGRLDALWELSSLATPSDLVADAKSPGLVVVTWSDNSMGEDGFKLERSTDGTNFSPLQTLPRNSTSYSDEAVVPGTTYTYRVKVFNWIGERGLFIRIPRPPQCPKEAITVTAEEAVPWEEDRMCRQRSQTLPYY